MSLGDPGDSHVRSVVKNVIDLTKMLNPKDRDLGAQRVMDELNKLSRGDAVEIHLYDTREQRTFAKVLQERMALNNFPPCSHFSYERLKEYYVQR